MKMEERERLVKRRGNRARFKRKGEYGGRGEGKRKEKKKRGRKNTRRAYRRRTACQFINEAFKSRIVRKIVSRHWKIWNIERNCMKNLAYKLKLRKVGHGIMPNDSVLCFYKSDT